MPSNEELKVIIGEFGLIPLQQELPVLNIRRDDDLIDSLILAAREILGMSNESVLSFLEKHYQSTTIADNATNIQTSMSLPGTSPWNRLPNQSFDPDVIWTSIGSTHEENAKGTITPDIDPLVPGVTKTDE